MNYSIAIADRVIIFVAMFMTALFPAMTMIR
jgi:hypothetical protein